VFKRIALLIATNFAIMLVLSVVLQILEGLGVFGKQGLAHMYGPTLVMAAFFGFGGAFISLLISRWVAKWQTGAQVIEQPRNAEEAWLLDTVRRHAQQAGLAMPEVAIYDAPEMNAFATGPSRNRSLVAVSTGLLRQMQKPEIDAVLGHEMAHVANGDMVTLTLIQGVMNTFVIFFSRVIGSIIDSALRGRDSDRRGVGFGYFISVFVAQIVLGFLAQLVVAWFSRWREYRADQGGASLAGTANMINALRRLSRNSESSLPEAVQAFGISGKRGLLSLLASHPPIEDRIAALEARAAGSRAA
jgi:heat shock protein HtpX